MSGRLLFLIFVIAGISFILGYFSSQQQKANSQKSTFVSDTITTPTPFVSPTSFQPNQQFSSPSTNQLSPSPTSIRTNPFAYVPLPTNRGGPENDIVETTPLTASRNTAQVDDSITFSVTIKNQASYNKKLWDFCFESTDGNFGCTFGIQLAPGQTYTAQNVGTWVNAGTKQVWVTWSQDFVNYYIPLNATTLTIQILG